jgi:hypothetical protein
VRTINLLAIITSLLSVLGAGAQTPPSAVELLSKAKAKAAEEHKAIFVVFDASW